MTESKIRFYDAHPPLENMAQDVLDGLSASPKFLLAKYFYDERGSQLFDAICELPEYYITRTEIGLLEQHLPEIAERVTTRTVLLELGSGSSIKIRILLNALHPKVYIPIDISKGHLLQAARAIAEAFPWLEVHAACADLTQPWDLPYHPEGYRRTAFFPGSSIGNFAPAKAEDLLARVADLVETGGGFLIGVDLKKDHRVLNAAYNDSQGVTAAFNKNLLRRLNRELDANFNLDAFEHQAFYNEEMGRIEMHLASKQAQQVQVAGRVFQFEKNETIHTESSYKYSLDEFRTMASRAGFKTIRVWTDEQQWFSVHYLESVI